MAITSVKPGDAPANTTTHKQAAEYLSNFTVNGTRAVCALTPDSIAWMAGDLEGLLSVLAVAFTDASERGEDSEMMRIDPSNLSSAMRSAARLAALIAFMGDAI